MKPKNLLVVVIFCSSLIGNIYSQELNLETGKTYKFVLFDDTEIIGKVLSQEKNLVHIETKDKNRITLLTENILYVTADLNPKYYKTTFTINAGFVSFNNGYNYYSNYKKKIINGPHIDLSAMFHIGEYRAIKIDAGFSFVKGHDETYIENYSSYPAPYNQHRYEGGDVALVSFKPNFVLGELSPKSKIFAFGSAGFGVQFIFVEQRKSSFYSRNYPDTSTYRYYENVTPSQSSIGVLLSIGGGLGFRVNQRFSITGDAELNLTTADYWKLYFPFRLGLNYSIF